MKITYQTKTRIIIMGFLLLLYCAVPSLSNDTSFEGAGGTLRPFPGEHPTVQMVSEWVKMDIYPKYYDVAVQFVFKNNGPATTVKMGFPEFKNPSSFEKDSNFIRFRTYVNGKRKPCKRVHIKEHIDLEYDYWVKTVHFDKGERVVIRVEYRAPSGDDVNSNKVAVYFFSGKNWQGKVRDSYFRALMHLPGKYNIDTNVDDMEPVSVTQSPGRLSFHVSDWEASGQFYIRYAPILDGKNN